MTVEPFFNLPAGEDYFASAIFINSLVNHRMHANSHVVIHNNSSTVVNVLPLPAGCDVLWAFFHVPILRHGNDTPQDK